MKKNAMPDYAKWISTAFLITGLFFSGSYFFELEVDILKTRDETKSLLLRFGLLFIAFGLAIMLTHVFGEKQKAAVQGLIFTGTLASAFGVLTIAERFVVSQGEFSHPNLDLVVICRTSPDFSDGETLAAMVRLNANAGKINRVTEQSQVLSSEEFNASYTHLVEPDERTTYITPVRSSGTEYRFEINELLPVSSNDRIDVILTSASQTPITPVEYIIFSSYIATGDTRHLIAEFNLEDAGVVCDG